MGYETFTPLYHEIFTKVNNAKDKAKKVEVLRKYDSTNLRGFLMCAFNPDIEWMLPEGDVPYMPNDAPDGTDHTRLDSEGRLLFHFVKKKVFGSIDEWVIGDPQLNDMKRETMFIQLLEGLSTGEAECLCMAKARTLHRKYKGLNGNSIRAAFGWDENFIDAKLVAQRAPTGPADLGRMSQDLAEDRRYG